MQVSDDDLFIETLQDLHYSISCSDEYEILRASHLIRQLLLDGANSLAIRVNKTRRLKKIIYPIREVSLPDSDCNATWFAGDLLASFDALTQPTMLKWYKFLKMPVACCEAHQYTVEDIIKYCAHVAGGVHKVNPESDRELALSRVLPSIPGNLNPITETLRSIGTIVLYGLNVLKETILGFETFEGGPGLSFYANFILAPMAGGEENYLIDIGTQVNINRITVFLDAHGDFCVRIYDSTGGKPILMKAGTEGRAYKYHQQLSLAVEIGCQPGAVLVNVDGPSWSLTRVLRGSSGPQFGSGPYHSTISTDVTGRCRGKFHMIGYVMYSNVPDSDNRINIKNYLMNQWSNPDLWAAEFHPGACMHSYGHPNFPPPILVDNPPSFLSPSDDRAPLLRKGPFK